MTKVRVTNHYPPSRGHISTIRLELDGAIDPKIVIHALEASARLSAPTRAAPRAVARSYGDAGVIYELYFTIEDFARAIEIESGVLRDVWVSLDEAGIRGAASLARDVAPVPPKQPAEITKPKVATRGAGSE
jgi:hypothetical protein